MQYDDAYPTCVRTHSTLRVVSQDVAPRVITAHLGVEPTSAFEIGDPHNFGRLHRKFHGWFYSTEGLTASKDTRRHLDLIIAALLPKATEVRALIDGGCDIDIISYWVSIGQGGPWIMPEQMLQLGTLGIPVWWDVYFDSPGEA